MLRHIMQHKREGFTLTEMIIVIVIVGAMAGLALPQFTFQVEKMKKAEGEQILYVLYLSQLKYQKDTGNFATNVDSLDVQVRAPEYFNAPVLDDAVSLTCSGGTGYANITRDDGTYTLHIIDDAVIRCTPCDGSTCTRLGYPAF